MNSAKSLKTIGLATRDKVYSILKTMHMLMPYGYSLAKIKLDDHIYLKLYTHYEGVQVVDEIFCLEQYRKAFELKPRIVVDVGAHIGTFTLLAIQKILNDYGDGLVIAIEPSSVNYLALLNNIKVNNVEKLVYPIKAAIASRPRFAEIEWIGRKERVRAITMHEVINIIQKLYGQSYADLVKMDIEGAELDVLTNNNDWLTYAKALVLELHPNVYGLDGLKRITESLWKAGFHVKIVRKDIDTRIALRKWIETISSSPIWLTLMLWKVSVSLMLKRHTMNYCIAIKSKI